MKSKYWMTGILLGTISIFMTVWEATSGGKGMGVFIHLEGIILVFGGTLTTVFTVYPLKMTFATFRSAAACIAANAGDNVTVAREVIQFAQDTGGDPRNMESAIGTIIHPFFREGVQLLIDRLEYDHTEFILKEKIKQHKTETDRVMNAIKGLAKYPPAFGMVGTLAGLVAMMKGLGSSVGAGNLGTAMAIGLAATFYGVGFANLLILPLADNIQFKNEKEMLSRRMIAKAVLLIKEGASPLLIQDYLNAMLKLSDRVDVFGGNSGSAEGEKRAA